MDGVRKRGGTLYLWSAPELSRFVDFGSHLFAVRGQSSSVGKHCSHDSHSVH